MGLIVHKGKVLHSDSFDFIEEYAAAHRTRVKSVELWGFERLLIGQVCIRWTNGATGSYVADSLADLRDYVSSIEGWPPPVMYPRSLPHSAGQLWLTESEPPKQEKVKEEAHAVRHIVRERHSDVRRRRTRAEVQV